MSAGCHGIHYWTGTGLPPAFPSTAGSGSPTFAKSSCKWKQEHHCAWRAVFIMYRTACRILRVTYTLSHPRHHGTLSRRPNFDVRALACPHNQIQPLQYTGSQHKAIPTKDCLPLQERPWLPRHWSARRHAGIHAVSLLRPNCPLTEL
eukprot:363203-Chlamydomonas_euryale.AAC.8